jgi:hypothetical protein
MEAKKLATKWWQRQLKLSDVRVAGKTASNALEKSPLPKTVFIKLLRIPQALKPIHRSPYDVVIPLLPESFSNSFSYSNGLTPLRVPRQCSELE